MTFILNCSIKIIQKTYTLNAVVTLVHLVNIVNRNDSSNTIIVLDIKTAYVHAMYYI